MVEPPALGTSTKSPEEKEKPADSGPMTEKKEVEVILKEEGFTAGRGFEIMQSAI